MRRIDGDHIERGRDALAQLSQSRLEQLGPRRGDVCLGQHDHRQHAAALHQREVALEAARVEVVIQAHDQQRGVDVADDRVAAAVGIAPRDVGERWQLRVDPPLAMRISACEHPVADGERTVALCKLAHDARQCARRALGMAIVQAHGFAVHFGEPHQLNRSVVGDGLDCQVLRHRGRQAHAAQAFEIDVDHGVR